jgi:hypothetical protein
MQFVITGSGFESLSRHRYLGPIEFDLAENIASRHPALISRLDCFEAILQSLVGGSPAANCTSELRQDADGLGKWNWGMADAAVLHQKVEV